MLAHTRAVILAVEPNPVNLFYLTSSLHAARSAPLHAASRAAVLPIGVGSERGTSRLFVEHSVRGSNYVRGAYGRRTHACTVPVRQV